MKKFIGIIFVLWANVLFAQSYGTYYDSAKGLKEDALKTALNTIIKGHTEFPYTDGTTDTWDILKETDKDPNNADNVIMLYSGQSYNAALEYNSGAGWSREHVWAKSRGDFGEVPPAGTDMHHLRAEDVSVNSTRNNRSFDNCVTCEEVWDNGLFTGSYTDANLWTFEPRDAVKGDVARMIFYMATRYEGENGEPDLEPTEDLPDLYDKSPFHGRLSTLIEWNREDPVDDWERNRNDIIYNDYQHNRNPYIDFPELVEHIWGYAVGLTWPSTFSTFPRDGETNVAVSTSIKYVFSEAIRNIDDSEITNDNVADLLKLKLNDIIGADIPFTATIDADKKVITLIPDLVLNYLEPYYASIEAVEDANENVNAFTEISFTTIEEDLTIPTFIFSPASGQTEVNISTKIILNFNEAIRNLNDSEITDVNVANLLSLKESNDTGAEVAFTAIIDLAKKIITVTPSADLKSGQLYYTTINPVEDASNNATIASNMTFTTAVDITDPTYDSSPSDGAQNVAIDKIILLAYSEPIRKSDDSDITNADLADLLALKENNASGASVSFTATIDDAKKIITITPNTELNYGQMYYVSMAIVEDYYDNASAIAEFSFTTVSDGTQSPFWTLDFEIPGGYTTSIPEFTDIDEVSLYVDYNYFLRTDGNDISVTNIFTNRQGSYFFGAQDIDEGGATLPIELNIDDIDISNKTLSSFSVYLAEDASTDGAFDWDKSDYVKFQYDVDNSGVFKNLLWVCNNGATYNSQASIDANFDGVGDEGNILTSEFKKITAALNVTGATLDIKILFSLNSGDEDIAIDNLSLMDEIISITTDNIMEKEIRIYPNPSKGIFFVELGDTFTVNAKIEVFNMLGMKVYQTRGRESKTSIDLSSLKQGVYYVRVDDGKKVLTQKVIKQ